MAETTYSYSIATDFTSSGGAFSSESMIAEIKASAIVTALEEGKMKRDGDDVDIVFKDALSTGDETILDGLVAAHTGVPPAPVGDVITTATTSADGTPVVTDRALRLGRDSFKRTDNNTESMNVDGRAGGTPVVAWNGTGAGDTGGDWTPSGTGSETAGSMHAGTNGWDTGVAGLDATTVFDSGSMQDIAGTYDNLTFWMQPKAYPGGSRLRVMFLDASDVRIGNTLLVSNYTANMDLDVWQQVSIPISDFGLTGNVRKLRFAYRNKAGQHLWFDDIELVASGGTGPYRFQLAAPTGERWYMSMLVLQIVAPETGWNNDAFGNIAGGLTNGLVCRQRNLTDSEVLWKFVSKDNRELFGQYHPQESFAFADSTLLLGFMVKPGKAAVVVTDNEVLEFVVRDDLSSLTDVRAYLHYGVEEVA